MGILSEKTKPLPDINLVGALVASIKLILQYEDTNNYQFHKL